MPRALHLSRILSSCPASLPPLLASCRQGSCAGLALGFGRCARRRFKAAANIDCCFYRAAAPLRLTCAPAPLAATAPLFSVAGTKDIPKITWVLSPTTFYYEGFCKLDQKDGCQVTDCDPGAGPSLWLGMMWRPRWRTSQLWTAVRPPVRYNFYFLDLVPVHASCALIQQRSPVSPQRAAQPSLTRGKYRIHRKGFIHVFI